MTVRTRDVEAATYTTVGVDAGEFARYASVKLENGAIVIYDQNDADAWIQASERLALDAMA